MSSKNYLSRKPQLMKRFDKSISRVMGEMVGLYGEDQAEIFSRESREDYEGIIPDIPYIGDRNPLLVFLLPASWYLAIYQTFKRHDKTVEDVGRLVYLIGEAEFKAFPGLVRRVIGELWFSQWFINRLVKRTRLSQERRYPGGYVLEFVEGDGENFDYGIDYLECASCKFLEEQDAMELAPYVCAVDKVASKMLGWGLSRTMTIAQGGERCDFRFKKGGKTSVPVPGSLIS